VVNNNIIIYGSHTCNDCRDSKKILDEYGLSYDYIDLDKNPEAAEIVEKLNDGIQKLPTIIFPNNIKLMEPSSDELILAIKSL